MFAGGGNRAQRFHHAAIPLHLCVGLQRILEQIRFLYKTFSFRHVIFKNPLLKYVFVHPSTFWFVTGSANAMMFLKGLLLTDLPVTISLIFYFQLHLMQERCKTFFLRGWGGGSFFFMWSTLWRWIEPQNQQSFSPHISSCMWWLIFHLPNQPTLHGDFILSFLHVVSKKQHLFVQN